MFTIMGIVMVYGRN